MSDPQRENAIRELLKIPTEATTVIFLTQNSHLDWDWKTTFRGYLYGYESGHTSVDDVLKTAFTFMREGQPSSTEIPYYYSIAEVGFLKAFIEGHPDELQNFAEDIGHKLRVVGGGITSPDNLLPHGEAFLRNHLIGALWVRDVLGLPTSDCWIPDDFGSDAQLPVMVKALGLRSAAFSRVGGISQGNQGNDRPPIAGSPAAALLQDGVDFYWQASDGSTVLAHYMQASYCQGNGIAGSSYYSSLSEAQQVVENNIQSYLDQNQQASSTEYVFVPVGCDFSPPVQTQVQQTVYNLRDFADWWNQQKYSPSSNPIWAVAASYDFYAELVEATASWKFPRTPKAFYSTPYWTGYYASRPENKILHQRATRALLAAEPLGILADSRFLAPDLWQQAVEARDDQLRAGWLDLVPSTHHDYITGTAEGYDDGFSNYPVYPDEQVPLLWNAVRAGESLTQNAIQTLAASLSLSKNPRNVMPVMVANPLGWPRTEVVELSTMPSGMIASSDSTANSAVQASAEESLLFVGSADAFGYATSNLTMGEPGNASGVRLVQSGGQWVFTNSQLTATLGQTSVGGQDDWAIVSMVDAATGSPVFPSGQPANALQFFFDTGGLYQFGNENYNDDGPDRTMVLQNPSGRTLGAVEIVEAGPLRARLRTAVTVTVGQDTYEYIREYTLNWDEPFLRVRATGKAPEGFSVATSLPLAASPAKIEYGTGYHWDDASATEGWDLSQVPSNIINPPVFQAFHDFVMPYSDSTPAFAVYQDSIQAWTSFEYQDSQSHTVPALFGILLRNPTGDDGRGATGFDTWEHEHTYAIRVPSGLGAASTGQPLQESRAFQTPLQAALISPGTDGRLPDTRNLAEVTSVSSGTVLMTAAKVGSRCPGEIVLRFYKPANGQNPTVQVCFDRTVLAGWPPDRPLAVRGLTALETDLPPEENAALQIQTSTGGFSFTPVYAVTTLAVGGHCGGYGSGPL